MFNWLKQDGAINDPFSRLTKDQQTIVRLDFEDGHSNKEIVPKPPKTNIPAPQSPKTRSAHSSITLNNDKVLKKLGVGGY